jgi:putative hydrolase of the HAD superfamily
MIRAVTFDFWNTLVFEERGHLRGRRLDAWAGILEEAGFAAEREALGAVMDDTWNAFNERWKANDHMAPQHIAEAAVDALGFDVPFEVRAKLLEAFGTAAIGAELQLTDGVADALRTLREAGVSLGIVCDVGFTASRYLRAFLDGRGLLPLFDGWAFSDEVGTYKPSPAIFEHVLSRLGVDAAEAAHVGDMKRTDVAGALGMGMTAVRYTGVHDDAESGPEAHHVIASHAELAKVLLP